VSGRGQPPALSRSAAAGDLPGREALPIVQGVLQSAGEPLDDSTRAFMEPRFGRAFGDVRIHRDAPAAGAAAALGAAAFAYGDHIGFARGRFRRGASSLMAHELAHTIQQTGTSPYLALKPDSKEAGPEIVRSSFENALLGKDRLDRQILVEREVGDPKGYDDRLQAIAVARLARADPAAVAQDKKGKWHAFATRTGIDIGLASAGDPALPAAEARERAGVPFKDVDVLPELSGIASSGKKVEERQDQLGKLYAQENSDEDAMMAARKALDAANVRRAAYVLGVGEGEIAFHMRSSEHEAGKVNLTETREAGANTDARHGPISGQPDRFTPDMITAFDIDKVLLDTPARAQGALFHEVSHLKDFELTQHWVRLFQTETRKTFARTELKVFMDWIDGKAKKGLLSAAEAQLVVDESIDATATTEARANIRTFLEFFRAGLFDDATRALTNYADALPPGTIYANPPSGSPVLVELTNEMQDAFKRASPERRSKFVAAMAAAQAKNKTAWFGAIKFGP